jgi:cyclophilin family peptidyl-prolyl cis-trans isomerase
MKVLSSLLIAAVALVIAMPAQAKPKKAKEEKNPVVLIKTSLGDIKVELDAKNAPISTANFMKYVNEKFYDGTIFHRVIPGFMIQGGGLDKSMNEKPTHDPIKNEGQNGLKNTRGTIAMARTNVLDSATSQFFINVVDNPFLDYPSGGGYAVFGKVISGMDTVDKIRQVPTGNAPNGMQNVPTEPVVIESIRKVKE